MTVMSTFIILARQMRFYETADLIAVLNGWNVVLIYVTN